MKWIKASERLPEKAKDISVDPGVIFRKISRTNTFVCHTSIRSFSFMGNNLDEWEWLDETESPDSEAVELKVSDELVEEKLITMMKEDPVKVLSYLVIQAGRTCQETNAGTLDLSTEATYDGKRYKVSNITTIKEITP